MYDHETIVNATNNRLIGFGRYAGIVGAYNGIRAFGLKFELFNLPKAETLSNQAELVQQLKNKFIPILKLYLRALEKLHMVPRKY